MHDILEKYGLRIEYIGIACRLVIEIELDFIYYIYNDIDSLDDVFKGNIYNYAINGQIDIQCDGRFKYSILFENEDDFNRFLMENL